MVPAGSSWSKFQLCFFYQSAPNLLQPPLDTSALGQSDRPSDTVFVTRLDAGLSFPDNKVEQSLVQDLFRDDRASVSATPLKRVDVAAPSGNIYIGGCSVKYVMSATSC